MTQLSDFTNDDSTDNERDECPDCGEGVMPVEDMVDEICTTQSVNSPVITDSSDEYRGHIMLLDYDDKGGYLASEKADALPGISLVLESSEGSAHIWNLTVRSLEGTALEMVMLQNELNHIRSGLKRGYWRLRMGPKVRQNGESYKSRPELVSVVVNETEREQSSPHWKLARSLYEIPDLPTHKRFNWTGDEFSSEKYATLTDKAKESWPNE